MTESLDLREKVNRLVAYIEENLRASSLAGLTFIDTRNFQGRLTVRQNHVIFGRRGAGKSSLVKSVCAPADHIAVRINLEDYKDISFPNILLRVLSATCQELGSAVTARAKWRHFLRARKLRKRLEGLEKEIAGLLYEPDQEQQQVRRTESLERKSGFEISAGQAATGKAGISVADNDRLQTEISRTIPVDKLARLQIEIPHFKRVFSEASDLMGGCPIFLILDDFYFVPKSVQPEFIDYFHRLTKDTPLFMKIATIKHRSRLFKTTEQSYIGAELEHDIFAIDMDYTLDKFADLKEFMSDLLGAAIRDAQVKLSAEDLFTGDGFSQLCLASGGVPRDFLSLFVRLANSIVSAKGDKIGKVEVNEEAIAIISSKLDALKVDSAGEREILESYLSALRRFAYNDHRTNAFLVAKDELEQHPQERQAIRELVDLRLIHLIDSNTSSAPSDGRRYEAYILDVGLYENSRPRNFNQVEPGTEDSRSRKDQLRASPRLSLAELANHVKELKNGELIITEGQIPMRRTARSDPGQQTRLF
ncbi:MAG: hypothetical protein LAO79_04125 [Acidobacteriia bacterium]|nr:hypothetical protein [Terriglobia bacterium]